MRPRFILPLSGLALCLSLSVASAQPAGTPEELFSEGLKLFAVKKYDDAAVALEASYQAKEDQRTLFAWAQAVRLSGKCDKSRELLAQYVAKGANEKQTRAAFKLMEDCTPAPKGETETGALTTTEGTDGRDSSSTTDSGGASTENSDSSAGTELTPTETSEATVDRVDGPTPWYKDWVAVGLFSAGVVSLGVSGLSYANALSLEDQGMEAGVTYEEFLDFKSESEEDRNVALIFGAGGVLCVGAGIAYLMMRDSGGKEDASAGQALSVQMSGQGAGFAISGRF